MVDIAVQGLVHSEHESSHTTSFRHAACQRALGDRWSLIVIRALMFGNRRHFRELLTRSQGLTAATILADRPLV